LRELTPALSPAHRLGAELRAYRIKSGHSQKSLGEKVHVSKSMIGAMETGDRFSTAAVIRACDEALGAAGELCRLWSIAASSRWRAGRQTTTAAATRTPTAVAPERLSTSSVFEALTAWEPRVGELHQSDECRRADRRGGMRLVPPESDGGRQGG
jgi:transcriptional regulator with XRE-family HTH domain